MTTAVFWKRESSFFQLEPKVFHNIDLFLNTFIYHGQRTPYCTGRIVLRSPRTLNSSKDTFFLSSIRSWPGDYRSKLVDVTPPSWQLVIGLCRIGFLAKRFVRPRCSRGPRFIKGSILIRGYWKYAIFSLNQLFFFITAWTIPVVQPDENNWIIMIYGITCELFKHWISTGR
jgi:hypothetical protein